MAASNKKRRQKEEKPASEEVDAGTDDAADRNTTGIWTYINKLTTAMGNNKLDKMTLSDVITKHPLIRAGKYVALPYLAYIGWFYLQLQHPEYISNMTGGLVSLRPAIYRTDTPRQLLVVATPGSGTVQMSAELRNKLSLEMGHESTDAAWEFTRDGTISWIHGMRFLIPPTDDHEKIRLVAQICDGDTEIFKNMGFHPAMYGPPRNKCSYRNEWDACWKSECYVTLLKEWGCGKNCEINFAKNIHQVRNPMETLESLVAKYCIGGLGGMVAGPFLTYASVLFPSHDFYNDSCVEATGTFMVMYLEAMVEARLRGDIDDFYRIEMSSACDVAKAAGLLSPNTTVYEPNHIHIKSLCDKENENSPAQKIVEKKLNKVNENQVKLGWQDLRGGIYGSTRKDGDRALEGSVKKMFIALLYDVMTVPLQYAPAGIHSEM